MKYAFRDFVTRLIKAIIDVICNVHSEDIKKVPLKGPLILAANHINFMEAVIFFTYTPPRPITGIAKVETWDSPILGPLFSLWGAIPIKRGEADRAAYDACMQALQENKILAILPEGTRSGNGELQKGQPGIVLLAARSGLPILPAVIWGQENFWHNLRRFKRTELFIRVGEPFKLKTGDVSFDRETRQRMVDEVMFRMAELMPEKYRGEYTDFSRSDTSLWAPFSFKEF
jgi:1-acyl-sn-glycerol-3-phosphate acyltransferase